MTDPEAVLIGVDVGTTTTSGGLVTRGGEVLAVLETSTHGDAPGRALDLILRIVSDLLARARSQGRRVEGIGIGLPGIVDSEAGTMRKGIHQFPELTGAPIADRVKAISGVPVFVDNDVNALALAEQVWGAGRGARSLVVLALGTGVGGAVILDGQLVRGKSGYAGEFGHMTVNLHGRACICGIRGCLATYAAGICIATEFRRRTGSGDRPVAGSSLVEAVTNAEAVFRAADAGDPDARALVAEACHAVGAAIGAVANTLNPEVIVLTGGIIKSLAPLESRILDHAADYGLAGPLADAQVAFVPGHKNQTVRGGAALVLYEQARRASSSPNASPGGIEARPSREAIARPQEA